MPDAPGFGETWAIDPDTGVVRWRTDGRLEAAASGVVLVGGGRRLSALDAVTGTERWTAGIDSRQLLRRDCRRLSIDGGVGMAGDGQQLFVTQVELATGDDFVTTAP